MFGEWCQRNKTIFCQERDGCGNCAVKNTYENPHSKTITDEASGVIVSNQRYLDWQLGYEAHAEMMKAE
jgi:hypothetical protein